ncbi:hypothetical protein M441DRAFT_56002 [Trichoderma asperellum CBS 433.97]|uniref:Uncharacterized protein n=1 Tax=Trichoderma asperellum (strain ATCC 204424 / CBS 433.97 / NBRC 101777) TaxID=1042311 RepID=A0A2T3ZDR2_TRIA4|nr:hypothetical protein M441DRAFT_56002 [Trichoderma asperellum CBS 433.97]PTB42952.1 hypothetical protein M441DRAFT_56002 [Trichoderma asperellum CBS 433.97]
MLAASHFVIAVSDGIARDGATPAPSNRALPHQLLALVSLLLCAAICRYSHARSQYYCRRPHTAIGSGSIKCQLSTNGWIDFWRSSVTAQRALALSLDTYSR